MREELRALIKLAEIDAQARGIDDRLNAIPAELDERRSAVRTLEALVEKQRNSILDAESLLAQQEQDIATRNESLAKAKAKGAKARTGREAEMAERELDAVRRSIKDGETERENLREKITQFRAALEGPEKALVEHQRELEEAEKAAEAKLAALREERAQAVVGREQYAPAVSKQTMRLYDRLRTKLVPVVAEVVEETCVGCRVQMPPQKFIELRKGTELMQCQMCKRIVYHRDILED